MFELPVVFLIAALGAFIGSFSNVVALRLNTGKSILVGRSKCSSCGDELLWYHLVPIISFLFLRGRCGHCGSRVSFRYVLVEIVFAALFGLVALATDTVPLLIFALTTVSIIGMIVLYDLQHTIIPDLLVVLLTLAALATAILRDGFFTEAFVTTFITALAFAGFFAGLWLVSAGKWIGLGDAKFIFGLALFTGFPQALSGFLLSFWLGALISVVLLVLFRKHRTISNEVPFAPYLALGFLCAYLFDIQLIQLLVW